MFASHRWFSLFFVALFPALVPSLAHAGFIELGASASYRYTNIDVNATDQSISYTGSVAYYFTPATALELSYTNGQDTRSISPNVPNGHVTYLYYQTAGADFVYTFGEKEAALRPYIKGGVVYILSKQLIDQYTLADGSLFSNTLNDSTGFAPSAGFGFRIAITDSLSLKIGVDGWSSRPISVQPVTVDWFGRAGLSWFF